MAKNKEHKKSLKNIEIRGLWTEKVQKNQLDYKKWDSSEQRHFRQQGKIDKNWIGKGDFEKVDILKIRIIELKSWQVQISFDFFKMGQQIYLPLS